jgi:hypothetical protein
LVLRIGGDKGFEFTQRYVLATADHNHAELSGVDQISNPPNREAYARS